MKRIENIFSMKRENLLGDQCKTILAYFKKHGRLPTQKDDVKLRTYIKSIRHKYKFGNLDKLLIDKLRCTGIFENFIDKKWETNYQNLIIFRAQNPDRWPSGNSKYKEESKLGNWCFYLKKCNSYKTLTIIWYEKLNILGFDFIIHNAISIWELNFEEVKLHLETNKTIKGLSNKLRNWCWFQCEYYYNKDSGLPKVQLLNSIDLFKYILAKYDWIDKYEQVKEFVDLYGTLPTRISNIASYYWLYSQHLAYVRGGMPNNKILLLEKVGVDFTSNKGNSEIAWSRNYELLILFIENNNGRWPSSIKQDLERKLYIWCNTQREYKKMVDKGLCKEKEERIFKLEKIGFEWIRKVDTQAKWNKMLWKLIEHYKTSTQIPSRKEGKVNPIYKWVHTNLINIKANTISEDRKERFLAVYK